MSNELIGKLNLPVPVGSLETYVQAVNSIPMLSAEQEHRFAVRLRKHGDLEAAQRLILAHLRFVVHVARNYLGYGLPLGDLVQEGNVGLMKAVKHFDPDRGVRLVSFAVHWIRAEIHEFILRNWRIVKIATTKAQRKLFFNLRKSKQHLGWLKPDEIDAVAANLNVDCETVTEMETRLSGHDIAFDPSPEAGEDDDYYGAAPAGYLPDPTADPLAQLEAADWETQANDRMRQALEGLDPRSRDIVRRRWLNEDDKATLHDLAAEYGVSAERIRQIENNAFKKLKAALPAV